MSFARAPLAAAIAAHGPVARVLVLAAAGSTPRPEGTAMLVWPGGQQGTIGGGALEWEATAMARARLADAPVRQSGPSRLSAPAPAPLSAPLPAPVQVRLPLGPALNQCCGGSVTLLIEVFAEAPGEAPAYARPVAPGAAPAPPLSVTRALARARNGSGQRAPLLTEGWLVETMRAPRTPVWIWGAGHVGRALAATLAPLDSLALTWLDTDRARFPEAPCTPPTVAPDPAALAATAPPDAHHLILTYSHSLDFALCDTLSARPAASIGLIGSATKWARFRTRLAAQGRTSAQISRITCPIGDPTLGKHPQAIAISTAAQLLSMLEKQAQQRESGDMTG